MCEAQIRERTLRAIMSSEAQAVCIEGESLLKRQPDVRAAPASTELPEEGETALAPLECLHFGNGASKSAQGQEQ